MAESNQSWGALAEHDQDFADAWDSYSRLPDVGENAALDSFCESKHITIDALVRVGARLAEPTVLAFAGDKGIKFRDIMTGRRWSRLGSEFQEAKIIRHEAEQSSQVIVAEGETDGAWLSSNYEIDIAIMQAGARAVTHTMLEQLASYEEVFVALDRDEAGEIGVSKFAKYLPRMARLVPNEPGDWCQQDPANTPELSVVEARTIEQTTLIPAGELMQLEVPPVASWFEHDLLPIGGLLVLHGWIKSFKSFLSLDMMAALAQKRPWCGFESIEEPCKVAVVQYEISWPYYRQRAYVLREHAEDRELFDQNFFTWLPLQRPGITAGNKQQEEWLLQSLTESGIQVVLFDPIRRLSGAIDMNSEQEVRRVLAFFERIQDQGITVVTTHHDNKQSAKLRGGDALGMTGSAAFGGDPDTIVSIELPRGDDYQSSTRRNLNFLTRNAPSIPSKGMEIREDGQLAYMEEPFMLAEDEQQQLPNLPSI